MNSNNVFPNVSMRLGAENSALEPNPFDPARLRLSQDFIAAAGVKKILNTIPVRKPSKEWFVQTHPDESYRIQTCVIELKEDSETYLVEPEMWPELIGESTFSPRALITAINRQGVVFLWPIRLPGEDGKLDDWSRSAMDAAEHARGKWLRISSNRSLGAYEFYEAAAQFTDPKWPDVEFQELLELAFRDRFIKTLDHPILRRLRGEA